MPCMTAMLNTRMNSSGATRSPRCRRTHWTRISIMVQRRHALQQSARNVLALFGELESMGIDLDRASSRLERESIGAISASVNTALIRLAAA